MFLLHYSKTPAVAQGIIVNFNLQMSKITVVFHITHNIYDSENM